MAVSDSLTTFATAGLLLLCRPALADQTLSQFGVGADLSSEQVAALEEMLRADPEDTSVRARLLGYYSGFDRLWDQSAQERENKHTLWFIRQAPESMVLRWEQDIDPCDYPAAYLEGKRLWTEHLKREPDNLALYLHAAQFMSHQDSDKRIDLLRQGQHRDESNPKWALELGFWLSLDIRNPASRNAIDVKVAKQSLDQYELAYELAGEDPAGRSRALRRLPEIAFAAGQDAKAREYAELAVRDRSESDHFEHLHRGNIVLGKLALREGDLKEAKARLLGSAAAPSGSDIIWFQPDFALASSLLERGLKRAVLRYLRLWSKLRTDGQNKMEDLIVLVRSGRVPRELRGH